MLSSSQLEFIEESINQGKVVMENDEQILSVYYPSGKGTYAWLGLSGKRRRKVDFVRPEDIFIGDRLLYLRPR